MIGFRKAPRRGFTLSEMLVVLGVLVVVTALAQPALRSSLGDSRLRSASKMLRTELAKARLKAMQSGIAQQFRYQMGNGRFEVAPTVNQQDDDFAPAGRSAGHANTALADRGSRAGAAPRPSTSDADDNVSDDTVVLSLPQGVSFDEFQGEPDPRHPVTEEGWSIPIVFYPNGKTENANIRIKGERNAVVEVSLRGLTGVATAGKPRYEEEATR